MKCSFVDLSVRRMGGRHQDWILFNNYRFEHYNSLIVIIIINYNVVWPQLELHKLLSILEFTTCFPSFLSPAPLILLSEFPMICPLISFITLFSSPSLVCSSFSLSQTGLLTVLHG